MSSAKERIISIDVLRGLVIVLMAIDHVRVYSGVPANGRTLGIFFTRWITHFCAPAFVFFAGTSAFLLGRKLNNKAQLARYLVTRGLLLIVLELTVIRFSWTFNLDYRHWILFGVIWMLGWCMILLAAIIWLPTWVVGALGILMIAFQQIFALVPRFVPIGWTWELIYPAGLETPQSFRILYVLMPWIGVMAIGYAFGSIMTRNSDERRRLCLRIGLVATAVFLLAGIVTAWIGGRSANAPPFVIRILNQQKYPPSQLFLLMTLGPTIALLPLAERARGWVGSVLATFGRVPFFYYLLHIPFIHLVSLLVWYLREGTVHSEYFATAPSVSVPPEHRWGLPLLYLVFFIVVSLLYFVCRWFAGFKARSEAKWIRYL